jgi:arylsulfatase A-like enzyme
MKDRTDPPIINATRPLAGACAVARLLPLALAALTAAALAGCVPHAPPEIDLAETTHVPETCAVVFWVDGLGSGTFERMLEAGKLPNIRRYLVDRGVSVEGAVASLPTITYANNVSLHTGMLPGHHDIVGNKWFDRHSLIFRNYNSIETYQQVDADLADRTVYEALANELTASILTPVRRGAGRNIDNWMSAGIAWYFGLQETVNTLTSARFALISEVANVTGRWPRFVLAYFVTPDTMGHAEGVSSGAYERMIVDVDEQIGHVCTSLERAGLLERTVLSLVSDHGFVDTARHFHVAEYFRDRLGVPTIDKAYSPDAHLEERARHFERARAVVVTGGDRRCNIHLRAGEHWWRRPSPPEIDGFARRFGRDRGGCLAPPRSLVTDLAIQEAVEVAVVRLGEETVDVVGRLGRGRIDRIRRDGRKLYRYRVLGGTDPLGYASEPEAAALIDGEHHDADAWLEATLDTGKPDCVVQLIELNDSRRTGDITLYAAAGWDFRGVDSGGHGGLLRWEIVVPWVVAGPGLPAGAKLRGARTVDLMPTILELIGRADAIAPGLDGRSIAGRLKTDAIADDADSERTEAAGGRRTDP